MCTGTCQLCFVNKILEDHTADEAYFVNQEGSDIDGDVLLGCASPQVSERPREVTRPYIDVSLCIISQKFFNAS